MVQVTLYTNPMSRGRIARWMLEEAGVDYAAEVLDYGGSLKSDEFLAINPMGKVPTIVHGDTVVTECAAICAYVAETFPTADLAPAAEERADYYRWMFFAAGPLEQAIINRSLNVTPTTEQQAMVGYGNYEVAVDTLEKAVAAHPYIAGDRFTAADVYVGSHVMWGTQFGTLPKREVFLDYVGRLAERSAYRAASQKDDALMPPRGAQN